MSTEAAGTNNKIDDALVVEGQKLAYDAFKHLTTLNTGSILLLATFIKDLFQNPIYKHLIPWIFTGFTVSIFGSLLMMFVFPYTIQDKGAVKNKTTTVVIILGYALSFTPFIVSITLFVIFSLKNFSN